MQSTHTLSKIGYEREVHYTRDTSEVEQRHQMKAVHGACQADDTILQTRWPAGHTGCLPALAAIVLVVVLGLVASTPGATDLLVAWVR